MLSITPFFYCTLELRTMLKSKNTSQNSDFSKTGCENCVLNKYVNTENFLQPCESEDPDNRRFSTRTEQLLTVQAQKASSRRYVKSKDKSSSL